ncbi:MAG: AMP-binding protein [Alphaproteobacteria bacterium]|nr:AMP-binding protein [Alphaproteobacteria bacterium SS10]
MLKKYPTVEETRRHFQWAVPATFNIAADICDRWAKAEPGRLAIIDVGNGGKTQNITYGHLFEQSNRLANYLAAEGLTGGRIAVLLPQRAETAIAHIAILKTGSVTLPLFKLFGPEALLHRLQDSEAAAIITDAEGASRIAALRDHLPKLRQVITIDGSADGSVDYQAALHDQAPSFETKQTNADDPAILIYTSGTTGSPKGALHAHRVLLGHLPGVEMSHDFLPHPGDLFWTPADWAWIGGLLDVLMPALHHGIPTVAHRFEKFTGEAAFDLIERFGIKNAFLPPTALKLMRQAKDRRVTMRSVASGGENLGSELIEWGRESLGCTINEFYGQTECNMIVSSCAALAPAEPGVMGFAVPGHEVAVIDPETGTRNPVGQEGEIAVLSPDPVMFIGYLNKPDATAEKFVEGPEGRWLKTGDRGMLTASGRFKFIGRNDDVITSSGYRIGPAEIEDCLIKHEAVQMAGVIGQPDDTRGEIVAAFIVLNPGFEPSDELRDQIAGHVKQNLAAYEYPRVIEFMTALPMTTTGKIMRRELRKQLNGQ